MDYSKIRRKTREVNVGSLKIGGLSRLTIQSMTNTDTADAETTVKQLKELQAAGCDIARLAVPTLEAAETVVCAKKVGITMPLVADIHFDHKIALRCV